MKEWMEDGRVSELMRGGESSVLDGADRAGTVEESDHLITQNRCR